MTEKPYEMDLHISEQWYEGKGFSYWIKVWGKYLYLDIPIDPEQIVEVLEEIPDNAYTKPGFRRRDFFATCLITPQQHKEITEYK